MSTIRMRIHIAADHTVSGVAPAELPPGEHEVTVEPTAPHRRGKPFRFEGFPVDDRPWDDSISLRREDMYGDDGR
ncbi:MAG TPA: hypothetical protein VMU82_20075 [Acetobacteraceae bacterium]|nr:hypothetical protein [Acetobacteraceae bacterium]